MGIEATTSTISTVSNTSSSSTSAKSNSDTSFKDEMTKVAKTEDKKDSAETKNLNNSNSKNTKDEGKVSSKKPNSKEMNTSLENLQDTTAINAQINFNAPFSMQDANMMLSNGIQQMVENTSAINSSSNNLWSVSFDNNNSRHFSMNESDANFFLDLTQNSDISIQNITAQAQNMINNGADISEVSQNVQVSQTLLSALNESRQNNQPIRIDFDQNISVILRVGRDGAISANFIPSDKIAEQYLRSNIDLLRSSFDEQDLPYTELSYSNASKEQNRKRREQNRQGE